MRMWRPLNATNPTSQIYIYTVGRYHVFIIVNNYAIIAIKSYTMNRQNVWFITP